MTSRTPPPPPPNTPITEAMILEALTIERPELIEQWNEEHTLDDHLTRLALNARWQHDLSQQRPTAATTPISEAGLLRAFSIQQAIWMAIPEDLERQNLSHDNPDHEPLSEQQLRSGWFSTSSTTNEPPPPTS